MRLQLSGAGRWPPLVLGIAVLGCGGEASTAQPPEVDRAMFEAEVYPILLRDCAFPACHGNPARFFRVHGPGRSRLDPTTGLYAPATRAELEAAFDRARSMLSGAPDPSQTLLVRKPLEPRAGGAAHMGTDALGRNVYASTDDPSWRTIARWAGVRLERSTDGGFLDATSDAQTHGGEASEVGAVDADATIGDAGGRP